MGTWKDLDLAPVDWGNKVLEDFATQAAGNRNCKGNVNTIVCVYTCFYGIYIHMFIITFS